MILPIYPYGHPILRVETEPIEAMTPEIEALISDMIETMHNAAGIGLAAPQVGRTERLFVADLRPMAEDIEDELGELPEWAQHPLVFINPWIVDEDEASLCDYEEGCLSIPDLRELVTRPDVVRLRYRDHDFVEREIEATGVLARVVQHETDHLDGVLFVDHLSPLRRRLLKRRLREIARGEVEADYPLAPPAAAQSA